MVVGGGSGYGAVVWVVWVQGAGVGMWWASTVWVGGWWVGGVVGGWMDRSGLRVGGSAGRGGGGARRGGGVLPWVCHGSKAERITSETSNRRLLQQK